MRVPIAGRDEVPVLRRSRRLAFRHCGRGQLGAVITECQSEEQNKQFPDDAGTPVVTICRPYSETGEEVPVGIRAPEALCRTNTGMDR
jgi:hypothetical protein